jgi:hypothetical protein
VVDVNPHPNSEINSKLEKGSTRGFEDVTPAHVQSPESAGERVRKKISAGEEIWGERVWLPPQLIKAINQLIKATNAKAVGFGKPTRIVGGYELSIWFWWTGDVKKVLDNLNHIVDLEEGDVHIRFIKKGFDYYNDDLIHVIVNVYFFDDMWKLFFNILGVEV